MAIAVSLETPEQDVRSSEEKFLANLKEKVYSKDYVSIPNITTFNFSLLEPSATYTIPFTVNYNNFWAYVVPMKSILLPNPKIDLQMQQVKEVVLTLNLYEIPSGAMGYTPPAGSGGFNIRFTVSFHLLAGNGGRAPVNLSGTEAFCTIFTLYFPTQDPHIDWKILSNPLSYSLSKTIELRSPGDFTNHPTRLTQPQFALLTSQDVYLLFTFGFAYDDYMALSAANRTLIDQLFRAGQGGFSVYMLGLDCKLNYFGFLSSFLS